MFFFFFKQKTAYEMRISDWSSDVCSSDLSADLDQHRGVQLRHLGEGARRPDTADALGRIDIQSWRPANGGFPRFRCSRAISTLRSGSRKTTIFDSPSSECRSVLDDPPAERFAGMKGHDFRSEEHTSELQSLMRTSYAVFCLKKK